MLLTRQGKLWHLVHLEVSEWIYLYYFMLVYLKLTDHQGTISETFFFLFSQDLIVTGWGRYCLCNSNILKMCVSSLKRQLSVPISWEITFSGQYAELSL